MRFFCLLFAVICLAFGLDVYAADTEEPVQPSLAVLPASADIRIGMSNALSGPTAALGTELRKGVEVYFEKVNREGGVYGRQLKLISYDDGYEPVATISNTRTLLDKDKAFLLFGYLGTPTSRVAVPIASYAGVPYIAPFTGAGFLRSPVIPVVFNVRASYGDEAEAMVAYLTETLKLKRIALFIQNDAYGSAGRNGVRKALAKRGMQVVAVGKYARNTTDISHALERIKSANPEAVIMVGVYAPSVAFIKEARQSGFNPVFMNMSFVGAQELATTLGSQGDGVYVTQVMPSPRDVSLPLIRSYLADVASSTVPELHANSYSTLEGYVNARVLVHMLDAAGPKLSRAGLISATERLVNFDVEGFKLSFSPTNHQGSNQVYLTQINSGTIVPLPLH